MKASVFIKVALIDQMQQIADLGLWYHLAKLLPSGFDVLARVCNESTQDFYHNHLPKYHHFPTSKDFFSELVGANSDKMFIWLMSEEKSAERHLQIIERDKAVTSHYPPTQMFIHVPQWFDDFKVACQTVLAKVEAGELDDIEIFPELNEQ